jgi:hypothetical protein
MISKYYIQDINRLYFFGYFMTIIVEVVTGWFIDYLTVMYKQQILFKIKPTERIILKAGPFLI